MPRQLSVRAEIPHSWDVEHWPAGVYPHSEGRARYLIRTYKDELLREGAMSRVGRELVFLGARYSRWLERRAAYVPDFEIAPNRPKKDAAQDAAA
ncbi:MAG: hypothetical protein ACREU3_10275 [Steroidobacteraceae bacterium]